MEKLQRLRECDYKCYPLTDYDEIVNFKPSSIEQDLIDEYCIELTPRFNLPGPKTLVCHDYKGGYLSDACIKGSTRSDEFRFYHWNLIDTFIYFSHHYVTIPPIAFINQAHKHGVEMLGTFIVEHKEGSDFLNAILLDDQNINQFSVSLANLIRVFKFDGWLLNIEVGVKKSLMSKLVNLVEKIDEECKKVNADSKIIWYDSVCYPSGHLNWQNELNQLNKIFFDSCDGIFLNYCWSESELSRSYRMAADRKHDVYVGVDVFGRNCTGGWNTKDAIEMIKEFDLSIAIFAPGWVHEVNEVKKFDENNSKFWASLNLPQRHLPNQLPLETFCCQGFGERFFQFGECVENGEWCNGLMQEIQLNCEDTDVCRTDSYVGGNCVILNRLDKPLLNLKLEWNTDLCIALVYKCVNERATTDDITIQCYTNLDALENADLLDLRHFDKSRNPDFYDQASYLQENLTNNWNLLLATLTCPNDSDDEIYIEQIYLHSNDQEVNDNGLKIGYLGIF